MKLADISCALRRHDPWIVWTLRIVVGGVFIMSGLVKDIDLWGFVYKIEEYLTAWGIRQPRSMVVMAALGISGAEFILGAMLATGSYKRTAVWGLLAMMAVMLPLTLYIYIFNPVSDCGCFGDFWKLSNGATFLKNIFITVALVWLAFGNKYVAGFYHAYSQWVEVTFCAIFILAVGLYGYNVQPLLDFRSFPVGERIVPSDDDDGSAISDVTFEFIYEKDGVTQSFLEDELPDSTWTFVERRLIDGDLTDHTELSVLDEFDDDVTQDVISQEGEQLIVVLPQYDRADASFTYTVNELNRYITSHGGSLMEIGAIPKDCLDDWRDMSMAEYPIYRAESTVLKELSRGVMSAVYVVDGVIVWKRTLSSINIDSLSPATGDVDSLHGLMALSVDGGMLLLRWAVMLVLSLLLLFLVDKSGYMRKWIAKVRKS